MMMMSEVTCVRMDAQAQARLDEAYAHVKYATTAFLARDGDDALIDAGSCMDVEVLLQDAGASWPAADDVNGTGDGPGELRLASAALDSIAPGDRPDLLGPAWAELQAVVTQTSR